MADPQTPGDLHKPGEFVAAPWAGAVPVGGGLPSVIRIPVPGTGNLAIELSPPKTFKGRSTSTLFIQDKAGKRVLRLDYGPNVRTGKTINYHWNQKGTFDLFKIKDHTVVGPAGEALYKGARAFKYLGRTLLVVGAVADLVSIAQASNPLRRSTEVVTAWALAWAGAESAGAGGALLGTAVEPGGGTAVLGLVFAIGGGIAGYMGGEKLGDVIYDWSTTTLFRKLPEQPIEDVLHPPVPTMPSFASPATGAPSFSAPVPGKTAFPAPAPGQPTFPSSPAAAGKPGASPFGAKNAGANLLR